MVSLAEPKRRNRYNLTPRGKALFEDETRFGTKMLEKMGWSKGKGLGANEDGSAEFVRVRYKHDAEGLGYEARDDQWTQHEQSFNGLLQTLNGNGDDSAAATKSADEQSDGEVQTVGFGFSEKAEMPSKKQLKATISGQSLEEKSKKSRARVHYKKFTRGKDLAQYSEKDLANIFGKKALDEPIKTPEENIAHNEQNINIEETAENFHSSSLSIGDYFKQKLNALKRQNEQANNCDEEVLSENEEGTEKVKKCKKRDRNSIETETTEITIKKKKHKQESEEMNEVINPELLNLEDETNNIRKKSKKHKKIKELEKESAKRLKKEKETDDEKTKNMENNLQTATIEKELEMEVITASAEILESEITSEDDKSKSKKSKKERKKDKTAVITEDNEIVEEMTENITKPQEPELQNNLEDLNAIEANDSEEVEEKSINHQHQSMPISTRETFATRKTKEKTPMTIEEIKQMYESYKVYEMSRLAAEKFRFLDLDAFKGSNIMDIKGYGMDDDTQIKIVSNANDEQKILELWGSTIDKTQLIQRSENTYVDYVRKVRDARKHKEKPPRFKAHQYKRKDVFKTLSI